MALKDNQIVTVALVIAEENQNNYEIKDWMAVVVDGINVKADTWYELKDGELIECKEAIYVKDRRR